MNLDAHQHFWSVSHAFTQWPTPAACPRSIAITVPMRLSQTAPLQCGSDNPGPDPLLTPRKLSGCCNWLELIKRILGVVGWSDLQSDSCIDHITRLFQDKRLVGLRVMLQDHQRTEWLFAEHTQRALGHLAHLGLSLDALVRSDQIPAVEMLAAIHPTLRIMLDHAGKPAIDHEPRSVWIIGSSGSKLTAMSTANCQACGLQLLGRCNLPSYANG